MSEKALAKCLGCGVVAALHFTPAAVLSDFKCQHCGGDFEYHARGAPGKFTITPALRAVAFAHLCSFLMLKVNRADLDEAERYVESLDWRFKYVLSDSLNYMTKIMGDAAGRAGKQ